MTGDSSLGHIFPSTDKPCESETRRQSRGWVPRQGRGWGHRGRGRVIKIGSGVIKVGGGVIKVGGGSSRRKEAVEGGTYTGLH